jgi:hypothetical protein
MSASSNTAAPNMPASRGYRKHRRNPNSKNSAPVGAEIDAQHRTGTAFEQPDLQAGVRVPDADDVVPRRRNHALALGLKVALITQSVRPLAGNGAVTTALRASFAFQCDEKGVSLEMLPPADEPSMRTRMARSNCSLDIASAAHEPAPGTVVALRVRVSPR